TYSKARISDTNMITNWVLLPNLKTEATLRTNTMIKNTTKLLGNTLKPAIKRPGMHILNIKNAAIPVAFTSPPPQNMEIFLSGWANPPSKIFNTTDIKAGKEYKTPKIIKTKKPCERFLKVLETFFPHK